MCAAFWRKSAYLSKVKDFSVWFFYPSSLRRLTAGAQPRQTDIAASSCQAGWSNGRSRDPEQHGIYTPFSAFQYIQRRKHLAALLPRGSIAILTGATRKVKSGVVPYPYRQHADYLYITGSLQPGVAVLYKPNDTDLSMTLLTEQHSDCREVWDGPQASLQETENALGVDQALALTPGNLVKALNRLGSGTKHVYVDPDAKGPPALSQALHNLRQAQAAGGAPIWSWHHLRPLVHRLRWRKDQGELDVMRQSAGTTAAGLRACITMARPGVRESDLAALFECSCKLSGAAELAFPPVVASGRGACTVHYSRNDRVLADGELLLMDAGCERDAYASDVTRTWPIGGTFTRAQRLVYGHVLAAHAELLASVRPGATLAGLHARSVDLLSEALCDLGVPRSGVSGGGYRGFYPHSLGHWLGIDVHDSAAVPYTTPLEPGVVIALEPGLYLRADAGAPREFEGIGVRIEDTVAVTASGAEVLSGAVPKEPGELERVAGSMAAPGWAAVRGLLLGEGATGTRGGGGGR